MFAEGSPAKGECGHTGNAGGEDERVLGNLCVPIHAIGWALKLLSETPWGMIAEHLHLAGGNLVVGHTLNIWMLRLTCLFC